MQNLRVIAKSSSEDKDIIVSALKQLKYICAVTGDETEDIKVLKKA